MKFETNFIYTDRRTKAHYIYLKYQSILVGDILDIGADQCYLKDHLGDDAKYIGVGLHSDKLDLEIDLEKQPIPYEDNSFDVVLCCDVLEHIENIHAVFDDLYRISKRYVIVSLANAYSAFYDMLCQGEYRPGIALKYYGLPTDKPIDRHKWFFSAEEAEHFIRHRSMKNGMDILQLDYESIGGECGKLRILRQLARNFLFDRNLNWRNLYAGTLWAALEKRHHV